MQSHRGPPGAADLEPQAPNGARLTPMQRAQPCSPCLGEAFGSLLGNLPHLLGEASILGNRSLC